MSVEDTSLQASQISSPDNLHTKELVFEPLNAPSLSFSSLSQLNYDCASSVLDSSSMNVKFRHPLTSSSKSWSSNMLGHFRGSQSSSLSISSETDSNHNSNERVPRLSFDSSYENTIASRGESILHLSPAIKKKVFIIDRHSIHHYSILRGNGMTYLPEVTITHNETGTIMHARKLRRYNGFYQIDATAPPVSIHMMLKNSISEALQFEDKDYQLALRIQSDLNNQRDNDHVVKLFHLMETDSHLIAISEIVNGTLSEYLEWIRNEHLTQEVFRQIVQGYARLLDVGYFHCNLCLDNLLIQVKPSSAGPNMWSLTVKLTGFEQAVSIGARSIVSLNESMKGEYSFCAPECFSDVFAAGAADIWSLGIILYCLCTGETPFEIANVSDPLFIQFCEEGFDSLRTSLDELNVNQEAIDLLRSMLVLDPLERIDFESLRSKNYVI